MAATGCSSNWLVSSFQDEYLDTDDNDHIRPAIDDNKGCDHEDDDKDEEVISH